MPSELVCTVLSPLPSETVSEHRGRWIEAVTNVTDAGQLARCGQEGLRIVLERITTSVRTAEQQLEEAGLHSKALGSKAPWLAALEESGREFVEQCAAIVEICSNGAAPLLERRILGCAVKLAEAFGKTGPLLASLEEELAVLSDRFTQLQRLQLVTVRQCEEAASEVPSLRTKVDEVERAKDELRKQMREKEDVHRSECRDLRRSLHGAEQRRQAAEQKVLDLRRELRALRQRRALGTSANMSNAAEVTKSSINGSVHDDQASKMDNSVPNGQTSWQIPGDHSTRAPSPAPSASRHLDEARSESSADLGSGESSRNGDASAIRRDEDPANAEPRSPFQNAASVLARGTGYASALNPADPLASAASDAVKHLTALVREAHERYPALQCPELAQPLSPMSPEVGLQWVATVMMSWVDQELSSIDSRLGMSLAQAASHLKIIAGLCSPQGPQAQ